MRRRSEMGEAGVVMATMQVQYSLGRMRKQ
jgi:hypothetical protein